jgi:hypothetical protein
MKAAVFRVHPKYGKRLYYAFRPLWWALHFWDWLLADRLAPQLSFGFSTLTAYPDPGTGGPTGSATVERGASNESISTIRAGAGSYASSTDNPNWVIGFQSDNTQAAAGKLRALDRFLMTFDTSGLTAAATISAAVLSIYGNSKLDAGTAVTPDVNIYLPTPSVNYNFSVNDFNIANWGSTAQCDSAITYAGWNTAAYNDFTLNATGRGNISKTGISKFGCRNANYDVADVSPGAMTNNTSHSLLGYLANETGTTKDPKLVVTYTVAVDDSAAPAVQSATFSIPAYSANYSGSVQAGVQAMTFSAPSYTPVIDNTTAPAVQAALFSLPGVTILLDSTATPGAQALLFSIPAYAEAYSGSYSPPVLVLTISIPQAIYLGGAYAVVIGGVDLSRQIVMGSLNVQLRLNQQVDTAKMSMRKYGSRTYTPAEGDEVQVYDPDAQKIFAGTLAHVVKKLDQGVLQYDMQFSGYAALFEARVVSEAYEDMTGDAIIADLLANYAADFTGAGVVADFDVTKITFNRCTLKEAIDKLAKLSNYSWYVDYEKDLHFFPRYTEEAPQPITDDSANYIYESLQLDDDYSQIRNRVYVRGGEIRGLARTESHVADGDQLQFPLANKFAEMPDVTVDGVPVNMGVDFLSDEDSYDAFWSYEQKYLRFKAGTKPTAGQVVAAAGVPLYRLIMQVEDPVSIARLGGDPAGVYEFVINEDSILSEDDARARAQAELEAYASKVVEGGFSTNTNGFRTGQIVHISSGSREASGDFIIQAVTMNMITRNLAVYRVSLATLRTLSIIDILIDQVRSGRRPLSDRSEDVLERSYFPKENLTIAEVVSRDIDASLPENLEVTEDLARNVGDPEYVYAPYVPSSLSDVKVAGRYGRSIYA